MLNPYEGGEFRVSQGFTLGKHNGLDLVGISGKKLLSVCDGTVYQSRIVTDRSNLTWQWGNYVTVKADTGELITYAHLSERLVSKGERIKKGDVIGIEGNTGYSFGSHCHLEVRTSENKVTAAVNTPNYTDIPNAVGKYIVKEEEDMTRAEVQEMIDNSKEKVYNWWKELPDWAIRPMYAMYKAGFFCGEAPDDLNASETLVRIIVIQARAFRKLGLVSFEDIKDGETKNTILKELGIV